MTEFLLLVIAVGIGVLIFRRPARRLEPEMRVEHLPLPSHAHPVIPQIVTPGKAPPNKMTAVLLMMLAMIYTVFPFDPLPDFIPILGWMDDIGFLSLAGKNLFKALKGPANPV